MTASMNLEPLVHYCRQLPHVVEDVKWGNDLVFSIRHGKMFCVFGFENEKWTGVSFKVEDHRFLELTDQPQFAPAPYMARARWVQLIDMSGISTEELKELVLRSHQLYFAKLSKRTQEALLSGHDD